MSATDYAAVHRDARPRVTELVGTLDDADLVRMVPACPGWTVLDVTRHLTGLAVDLSGETLPGPEDWVEEVMDRRHIDGRQGMSLPDVLDEWQGAAPGFEKTLGTVDARMAGAVMGEYACHEHDIRGALGRPGARTTLCTNVATDTFINAMLGRAEAAHLPALQVHAGDRRWGAPDGVAVAKVSGEPFELFRAVTGRRTVEQIRALDWDGDAEPYISVFSAFGTATASLGFELGGPRGGPSLSRRGGVGRRRGRRRLSRREGGREGREVTRGRCRRGGVRGGGGERDGADGPRPRPVRARACRGGCAAWLFGGPG